MSDQQVSKAEKRELPPAHSVEKELRRRFTMRWRPVILTFELKIRKPSALKSTRMIRTASFVTNLKSRILEHYKEDYLHPRSDGAIALVLSVGGSNTKRSNAIGTRINSEFVGHLLDDYRFASRIPDGACRAAATMMINWVQNIASFIERREAVEPAKKKRKKPAEVLEGLTIDDFYAGWRRQAELYEQAATTIIPFGRHKGTPLDEIGRREARWLISHMLPKADLEQTLKYVNQLLAKEPDLTDDALFVAHPYKTDDRHKRALQARRLIQRVIAPISTSEPTLLGLLQANELAELRDELLERINTGAVLDQKLELSGLQETLAETIAASEDLETLQDAFEIFLYGKPMNFPSIALVDPEGGYPIQALADYQSSLKWFRPNPDRLVDAEKYADERLEARAREHLERTSGRLRTPKLQPIPFVGTTKPSAAGKATNFRDCALLFDEETGEYVFIAKLRGIDDPLTNEEIAQRKALPQNAERWGKLHYANLPLHTIQMSERVAIELYPLEWGEASVRSRFLRKRAPMLKALIAYQRQAQEELFEAARAAGQSDTEALRASLAIDPMFTTAKIVTRPKADGKAEFFVQITAKPPVTQRRDPATSVIGIHEHRDGYSYAIIGFDGKPLRGPDDTEQVGDILTPAHVDPTLGARKSKNYAHEVANAIIRQAEGAFLGLEDTGYRKAKSDLSRERNREIFQRPSKLVVALLDYKARHTGIPAPLLVRNVSPSRDCGVCGVRLPKGVSGVSKEYRATCPQCTQVCPVGSEDDEISCLSCQFTWSPQWRDKSTHYSFRCPSCFAPARPARHNTAIVVAQETLRRLKRRAEQQEEAEADE
ncbi:hypothetical protein K2Z83_15070 [Oscillochloris sp. ZM17-4]|uniref:hypothetical protein n=1 Tax=Oscillochloris sp. ZM17-4 TaxID=2866714 RepID=UPI001C733D9C|nr:hypothetical protein [Oscillochloris sp. ZM17-4]MBX0328998.1 hypothetical protein [Oscillochloris sp. ZM17-4]